MIRHKHRTILGPIPAEWDDRPVGSLLAEQLAGDWGDDAGEVVLAVLRSTNFTDAGSLDLRDVAQRWFSSSNADGIQVRPNDILLERSGGGPDRPVGRAVFVPDEMPRTGFANFVQCLRPNCDVVDPQFLLWLLFQLHRCGEVTRVQHQTTQMRNLDLREYLRLRMPYPGTPEEQTRIARTLTAADDHIRALEEQIRKADRVKKALLQSLFIRGMPGDHHEFRVEHDVHFPRTWRLARLGDLLTESEYGLSVGFAEMGKYQILRMENVTAGNVHLREPVYLDLSSEDFERYRVKKGDILFNRTNSWELVGRVGIAHDDLNAVFASYLVRLRTKQDEVNPFFLNYALNSHLVKRRYRRFVTPAVSQANINVRNLRQTLIAIPVKSLTDEQDRIVDLFSVVDQSRTSLETQLAAAQHVKQSLLQHLLTGRIRLEP